MTPKPPPGLASLCPSCGTPQDHSRCGLSGGSVDVFPKCSFFSSHPFHRCTGCGAYLSHRGRAPSPDEEEPWEDTY